jgi:flagellar hook assembly protein FlgD
VNGNVTLKVYDILGNEVATLVNEEKQPGVYEVEFNASSLSGSVSAKGGYASGVYFYQLKAGEFTSIKKMILLR